MYDYMRMLIYYNLILIHITFKIKTKYKSESPKISGLRWPQKVAMLIVFLSMFATAFTSPNPATLSMTCLLLLDTMMLTKYRKCSCMSFAISYSNSSNIFLLAIPIYPINLWRCMYMYTSLRTSKKKTQIWMIAMFATYIIKHWTYIFGWR